ncbi:MAG: OmpA family protein [Myxococcota bacterium]
MGGPVKGQPVCGVETGCFREGLHLRGARNRAYRRWMGALLWLLWCVADGSLGAQESPSTSVPAAERTAESGGSAGSSAGSSADGPTLPGPAPAMQVSPALSKPPAGVEHASDVPLNFFPVYFSPGDIELRVDSQTILQFSAQALLQSGREGMIRIEGRSDGVETAPDGATREARLSLSRRRAEVVRDFLAKQGVPSTRFIVVGLGSSSPLGLLESERDRERNRVVTLSLMGQSLSSQSRQSLSLPAPVQGEVRTYASSELNQAAGLSGVSGGEVRTDTAGVSPEPERVTGGASSTDSSFAGDGVTGAGVATASSVGRVAGDGTEAGPSAPGSVSADGARKSTEVIAIRERSKPRGPGAVETVQLGLRIIKREGPGATGGSRWPIQDYLQQAMPELERLFRAGLTRERALVGETRIALELDAEGAVTSAKVVLPYPQPEFEAELTTALGAWFLPTPPGQAPMRLEFALTVYATFQHYLMTPR